MPQPRTQATYEPENVKAAYSALLEVAASLQSYRDSMVLIGGWVPYLLLRKHQLPDNPFRHVGSIDSDWVIDPSRVDPRQYDTIVRTLEQRGFVQAHGNRFRLVRQVGGPGGPGSLEIAVDLLTVVPPEGEGAGRRHRAVQPDLQARVTPAAEVALRHCETLDLEGELPTGGRIRLPVRVADVVGSLATKGLALGRRYEEKDNYDIYSLVANFGDGPLEVAKAVRPSLGEPVVASSMAKIREWFPDLQSAGPVSVADFFPNERGDARARLIRDAYETLDRFLVELGFA